MRIRPRTFWPALAAIASLATGRPAHGAPVLPVGAGAWGPSTNVTQSAACKGLTTATTECQIRADSLQPRMAPLRDVETCRNASYVVTTPVVVGTNFGCKVVFSGFLRLTGTGTALATDGQEREVAIEAGACAGVTLYGFQIDVTDHAAGTFRVYPRVTVSNAGWAFQGQLVGVDASTASAVVLDVSGTVQPGCTSVRLRDGTTDVTFNGVFQGSYQLL